MDVSEHATLEPDKDHSEVAYSSTLPLHLLSILISDACCQESLHEKRMFADLKHYLSRVFTVLPRTEFAGSADGPTIWRSATLLSVGLSKSGAGCSESTFASMKIC